MFKIRKSFCSAVTFAFFGFASFFQAQAAVTVGGVVFDSSVVNDNLHQTTPSNYFCTQTGNTISLSGQQPNATSNVTYFYNHSVD